MNRPVPSFVGVVAAMVRVDMRRLFRDRVGLFFVLLLPVGIILLIGLAFGGDPSEQLVVAVVHDERDELATAFVARLGEQVESVAYGNDDAARGAVRDGDVGGAVVVVEGYGEALRAGEDATVAVVTDPAGRFATTLTALVDRVAGAEGALIAAARFASGETGASEDDALARARALAADEPPQVKRVSVGGGDDPLAGLSNQFSYTAPSNLVLFTFITPLASAAAIIEVRRRGIARRALAAPITSPMLLAGLSASRLAIAMFQALFIVAVGALVFDVDWGHLPGAFALTTALALVGAGAGVLGGALFRTPEQASSIGPPIGIAFGMLGGCMWPLEVVPPAMRSIGHATPHAWAMDGFIELVARDGTFADVLLEIGVLLAFAAVLLVAATWRLREVLRAGA